MAARLGIAGSHYSRVTRGVLPLSETLRGRIEEFIKTYEGWQPTAPQPRTIQGSEELTEPTRKRAVDFQRVAARRVNAVLVAISSLRKCSNKNNYIYTPEQIKTMEDALLQAVADCMSDFTGKIDQTQEFKW